MLIRYRKVKKPKQMPAWLNLAIAGTSGLIVTAIVQPLDLLKTRMQLTGVDKKSTHLLKTTSNILKYEGITGFYRGLTAAILKQATYNAARMECYSNFFDLYINKYEEPTYSGKMGLGMVAGGIGAFISTPAEVALIRMTADGRLPISQKRNYKHVFNAFARITREEGITTLWRGASATVTRAVITNAVQLGAYVQVREALMPHLPDGVKLYFAASLIAGFVATVASLPVDIVKTRVQNAVKVGYDTSQFKVLMAIIKNEGVLALWSGLLPAYCRAGPSTILVFLLMEQLNVIVYGLLAFSIAINGVVTKNITPYM